MQFQKAVQALCGATVDFVVIGGVAATFHGSARVTYDLGIGYSRVSAHLRVDAPSPTNLPPLTKLY